MSNKKRIIEKRNRLKTKIYECALFSSLMLTSSMIAYGITDIITTVGKHSNDLNRYYDFYIRNYKVYNPEANIDEVEVSEEKLTLFKNLTNYFDREYNHDYVVIDLAKDDLREILRDDSIKNIKILNPELKTAYETANIVNNSNVEHVDLVFNFKGITEDIDYGYHVNDFEKELSIINVGDADETQRVAFLYYLRGYEDSQIFEEEKTFELRDKIDEMYEEIGVVPEVMDIFNIYQIASYICSIMEYDPLVIEGDNTENTNTKIKGLIKTVDYNMRNVETIVDNDEEVKYGICDNYATLFYLFSLKAGLPVRKVEAYSKTGGPGHAFNLYHNYDDCVIDITSLDANHGELLKEYKETDNDERRTEIHNQIFDRLFLPVEAYEKMYEFRYNKDDYFKPIDLMQREGNIETKETDINSKKYMNNFPLILSNSLIIGIFTALMPDKKKKEKKENKYKVR